MAGEQHTASESIDLLASISTLLAGKPIMSNAVRQILRFHPDTVLEMGNDACPTMQIEDYVTDPRERWKLFEELCQRLKQNGGTEPSTFVAAAFLVAPITHLKSLIESVNSSDKARQLGQDFFTCEKALGVCKLPFINTH